ncbi:MAG TPA: glycosyl hydrolase [Polyangiaceae bacterium]|nr:glycosyl hydrolase [Polyangiaceae bacterium]
MTSKRVLVLAAAAVKLLACSSASEPVDMGSAGAAVSAGGPAGGGAGNPLAGAGGNLSAAGGLTAGGASPSGGAFAAGGASNSGGAFAAGGALAAGGASNSGGALGVSGGSSAAGAAGAGSTSNCAVAPIDPSATPEAKKLLCYLYSIYGNKVLSGQQETSWSNPQGDIDYYVQTVNKHPAILGGDYLYTDGAKLGNNTSVRAQAYWAAGGLTMLRYHMGAPPLADTYDNSKGAVANFDNLTKSGTSENTSLNSKLDYMAAELKFLQDAKVPVMLVPYHEIDKFAWFWWSKCTGAQFINLWKYSVDYITKTKGVHNVLWMVGYGHDGAMADFWPGKEYADLGGIDQYDKGTQPFANLYAGTKAVVGPTMPIPLHETGTIPQPSAMFPTAAPWLMWNVWATYQNTAAEGYTWNTPETIKSAYADSHTITRETLPNLK